MTNQQPFVIDLGGGGSATLVVAQGERATFDATRPFPPGSPMAGHARDGTGEYRIKVRGSRRLEGTPQPTFRVEGRFVNLTRSQREHLEAACVPRDSSASE